MLPSFKTPLPSLFSKSELRSNDHLSVSVVRLLLSQYPTAAHLADRSGWTPVHLICLMSPEDEDEFYLPGGVGSTTRRATTEASLRLEILHLLLEASPMAVRATTCCLEKPLHIAARHYYSTKSKVSRVDGLSCSFPCRVIRLLLSKDTSAAAATDAWVETPLHRLASYKFSSRNASDVETVRLLLEACPEAKAWRNGRDLRPYDLALRAGTTSDEILSLLAVDEAP